MFNMDEKWMNKPSVAAALKGLDETMKAKFLAGVQTWRNIFAEPKWQTVITSMHDIVGEDHVKDLEEQEEPSPMPESPIILRRHDRPVHLARVHTAGILRAPSTTRKQRKLLGAAGRSFTEPPPTGNSFAAGGFWDRSSPHNPTTPSTPTPRARRIPLHASWSPIVLRDSQSKAIYSDVKMSIDKMALKVCASRLNLPVNQQGQAVFHSSLVTLKDELCAAEIVLHAQKTLAKPQFDAQLPKRLQEYATVESTLHENHQITGTESRLSSHLWRNIDVDTGEMIYIVDQHRQLLRMNRHRRKSRDLDTSREGVQLAWTVRILEDIERRVQYEEEHGSVDSEEDGKDFDYTVLAKDIKRQFSASFPLATKVTERSSWETSSEKSTRPAKSFTEFHKSGTSLKERLKNKLEPRDAGSAPIHNTKRGSPPVLKVDTSLGGQYGANTKPRTNRQPSDALVSPEEKEFRRRAPSHADLQSWSNELQAMEDTADTKRNSVQDSPYPVVHPALRRSRPLLVESSIDLVMIPPKYNRTELTSAARQANSAAATRPQISLATARALKGGALAGKEGLRESKWSSSSSSSGKPVEPKFCDYQFPVRRTSGSDKDSEGTRKSSPSDRAEAWSKELALMEGKEEERRLVERE